MYATFTRTNTEGKHTFRIVPSDLPNKIVIVHTLVATNGVEFACLSTEMSKALYPKWRICMLADGATEVK